MNIAFQHNLHKKPSFNHCSKSMILAFMIFFLLPNIPSSFAQYKQSPFPAQITSPRDGSALDEPKIKFEWTDVQEADSYWIFVGTRLGKDDIFSKNMGKETETLISDIPQYGQILYVRLWTKFGILWLYQDYRYFTENTGSKPAEITNPANGTLLKQTPFTVQIDQGRRSEESWLSVGSHPGQRDISNFQIPNGQSSVSLDIPNIPFVYLRLWSKFNEKWFFNDYAYSTEFKIPLLQNNPQQWMTAPLETILKNSNVIFKWPEIKGASKYELKIGTSQNKNDLMHKMVNAPAPIHFQIPDHNLSAIYVRLRAKINGQWEQQDYIYLTPRAKIETAKLTSPQPGSMLSESSLDFQWTEGNDVEAYRLSIGIRPGDQTIYSEEPGLHTYATIESIPHDGNVVFARLESKINGQWYYEDYSFGTENPNLSPALIDVPPPGSMLTQSEMKFSWSRGEGIPSYHIDVGSSKGGKDVFSKSVGNNTSVIITNIPLNEKSLFVRLWSKIDTLWEYVDYEYNTAKPIFSPARITRVINYTETWDTSMHFEWEDQEGFLNYKLQVGTQLGHWDLFDQELGGQSYAEVPHVNADAIDTIYVRLWSGVDTTWMFEDYLFKVGSDYSAFHP